MLFRAFTVVACALFISSIRDLGAQVHSAHDRIEQLSIALFETEQSLIKKFDMVEARTQVRVSEFTQDFFRLVHMALRDKCLGLPFLVPSARAHQECNDSDNIAANLNANRAALKKRCVDTKDAGACADAQEIEWLLDKARLAL